MVTCAMTAISSPGGIARGDDGFAQFVQIAEGLEDQEIDAGFQQGIDLLAEGGARFGEGGGSERLDAHAQGPDGAGHEGAVLGGLARQAHAGAVDRLQLLGHAERGQARPAGAEGVGLEDLGAGLDVFLVNLADHVGRTRGSAHRSSG